MTREEIIVFIDQYITNSAIPAFTNNRLNTVLKALASGGITDTFDTYQQFKDAIAINKEQGEDYFMRALVKNSRAGKNRIFEYVPSLNQIFWTASQRFEQLK